MADLGMEAFARELADEVDEAVQSGQESPYHEQEFTRIVLERLSDEGALENPEPLWQEGTFGRTVYKISGYSIPDDEERLVLITAVYTGDTVPRLLSKDEILKACQQAMKFYECSRKGLHKQIEPANTDASDLARRIFDAGDRIAVLRVIVVSDGLTGLRSIDLKNAYDDTRVIVDLFGIEQLYRILGEGLTRDDIAIDLDAEYGQALPCLKASTDGSDYEAFLAVLPGSLLADIYEKYGMRLLELNVRAFLGLRGRKSVNANLRQTIREAPTRFLAYNNGIVATVDSLDVEVSSSGSLAIKSLRGLQIVNGGQTTASLHRALRQDKADLSSIQVPAKIIHVGDGANLEDMVSAVSRSANSQNTVQPADFSANDPFHVAVETLANNVWLPDGSGRWFYERARGSYGAAELASSSRAAESRRFLRETPKERRFSKTDLAKYLNAWDGYPNLVSYGNQKNFQYFMQAMRDNKLEKMEPDQRWYRSLIAKAILFRAVQNIVKSQKFPAYQANIAAYTVACLGWQTDNEIDFNLVWTNQSLSSELREMLGDWVKKVDVALRRTADSRMPSEWAKKSECWDALRDITLPVPSPRPPELLKKVADGEDENHKVTVNDAHNTDLEEERTDFDRDKIILNLRDLFGRGEAKARGDIVIELSRQLGYRRTGSRIKEELENVIRTAVRRGILENRGDGLGVLANGIGDYERDFLKEQFLASLPGRTWTSRESSVRAFARWLGFRRVGSNIEETAKSITNGLIRDGKIESNGAEIRRC